MIYGISGNTKKEKLWAPVAHLVTWLLTRDLPFSLHQNVARGLIERSLVDRDICDRFCTDDVAATSDIILSFGGDGTFLKSAHDVGTRGTPILGVNIGRLGFLAGIEVGQVSETIDRIEKGDYWIESRMTLEASLQSDVPLQKNWALNEFVIERSGSAKLISIDVLVDGTPLNTYWADGLIIATPTGSTAYSLAAGGPILAPGCGAMILTPISPHMLTVRPIVLPESSVIEAQIPADHESYVLAADGQSTILQEEEIKLTIRRAAHTINLVRLPEQHYFHTLRTKLMWGVRHTK